MGYTFPPERGRMSGMPWKESSVMDERMRFVIRLKDGESMASLCREFGISRKTSYKIFERYEKWGLEGLTDRTRGTRHKVGALCRTRDWIEGTKHAENRRIDRTIWRCGML